MAISFNPLTLPSSIPKIKLRSANSWSPSVTVSSQMMVQMQKDGHGRRVWRRRRLVPLFMSCDEVDPVQFDFVNEIAAEANEYVENNVDEYGGEKKAILHVLSNRMNDLGFPRRDAYAESDPFKPGPDYLKLEFT